MTETISEKLQRDFEEALKAVENLPNQPPEVLLEMYGLYKQVIQGDITGKRPSRMNLKKRYKYDAWASRKGMSKESAMKAYIKLIESLEKTGEL